MSWDIAFILGLDGFANGAVYLLAGLGLVLIFSVTRVVFVPFGDVAAFAALSLAAFEAGRLPPTVGLVAMLALLAMAVESWSLLRRGEGRRGAGDEPVDAGEEEGERRNGRSVVSRWKVGFNTEITENTERRRMKLSVSEIKWLVRVCNGRGCCS